MEQLHATKGTKRCREADTEESPSKRHHAEEEERLSPADAAGTALVNEPSSLLTPGYKLRYTKVVTLSQRRQYMRAYKQLSKEYCALHARVDGIQPFCHLLPGLKQFQEVHDKNNQGEKNLLEHNLNHTSERQRLFYLHHKRAHIKKLCADFDHWWRNNLLTKVKRCQERNSPGCF
ncbi:RNA polymerase II elongation factor ELL2-like [Trichomycterus rosablanca]|uniref:RNA polymerase II elongation factor ELL2-like n=1 Tax=Trichomycterus rosablanca TaxID=2290929 RepID=UPI002F35794D